MVADIYSRKLTIITTTCEKYYDVLEIHEKLYDIYWNDCPFKRYLVIDSDSVEKTNLNYEKIIKTGKETGKKSQTRLNIALQQIETPFVMFVQEDMLLCNKIDNTQFINLLTYAEQNKVAAIKLNPIYLANKNYRLNDEGFIDYPAGTPYRISYAPTIWDKDYLLSISNRYEYGADFERKGTFFSNRIDGAIIGTKIATYPHFNAIWRGKWNPSTVYFLSYYGITPNFDLHPLMNSKDIFIQGLMGYIFSINPNIILKIQNAFHIGKSY